MPYLKENVDDENIEHIFEGVDDTVEHSLELGDSLDRFQRPENTEDTKGFDRAQILAG